MSLSTLPRWDRLALLALDLDGTVLCPYGRSPLSPRTAQAILRVQERGLPVTFVTGRTEDYAAPLAAQLRLTTPLVTYNGARLYAPDQGRAIYQASIDRDLTPELLTWLDSLDGVVALYWDGPEGLRLSQNRCSGEPTMDDYLFGTPRQLVGSLRADQRPQESLSKAILMTREPTEQEAQRRFGSRVRAVRTHPDLLELLPQGVDKGSGVRRLCQLLEIDPARVLAIGDQENDIATFQAVGYAVAMGDAPTSVRAAAGWVTRPFAEHGCAEVLETLLQDR